MLRETKRRNILQEDIAVQVWITRHELLLFKNNVQENEKTRFEALEDWVLVLERRQGLRWK